MLQSAQKPEIMKTYLIFILLFAVSIRAQLEEAGIINEDADAIRECDYDLARYQAWDDRTLIEFDKVAQFHDRFHDVMYDAFDKDIDLFYRLDNYSLYYSENQDYRGPSELFNDCHDLCPSEAKLIGGVIMENVTFQGDRELCLVVHPEIQNIRYRRCLTAMADNVPITSNFQNRFACVPDGFMRRKIIVYCPWAGMGQCREESFNLPMACSPKLARCKLTYAAAMRRLERKRKEMAKKPGFMSLKIFNRGAQRRPNRNPLIAPPPA